VLLALALARPIDVLEEWDLLPGAPLRESVTARVNYRRGDGPAARLPEAVQGQVAPQVFAVGQREELSVQHGPDGWTVDLPPGERDTVRLVARVVRPVSGARLFRLDWPASHPATVPTRRVATVPREWRLYAPAEWTCPEDELEEVSPCVSTAREVEPLRLRVPAPRASAWSTVLALLAVVASGALATLLGAHDTRRPRMAGALGGAFVGLALLLALTGALATSVPIALLVAGIPSVALGALASRTRGSMIVGGGVLMVLPLLVVFDGRLRHVLPAAALAAVLVVVAAFLPRRAPRTTADAAPPA
jgi:uncharacterized membrane protein